MEWLQITVTTTTQCADLVSMILLEAGSDGISIVDKNDIQNVLKSDKSWDYADESLINFSDERVFVKAFFDEGVQLQSISDSIEQLKRNCDFQTGSLEIDVTRIKSSDWENEWKKYYQPIEIGNVVIVPKWINYDTDKVKVLIDPGMAFGTGKHETTGMCIKLMQNINLTDKTVADVGCGSGILGITAIKLGAQCCIMSDIDSQAVKAAGENAALNGVSERAQIYCGDLAQCFEGVADVVVANITADILLRLKQQLGGLVKQGGFVIISGLINKRADEVAKAYQSGFELLDRIKEGEWQAMLLKAL